MKTLSSWHIQVNVFKFRKVLSGLAVFSLMIFSLQAHAADRYALVCLSNDTDDTINYQFSWGEYAWQERSLAPYEYGSFWHEFAYPNENYAPSFYLRFDSDMTSGEYWLEYSLKRYSAPETDCSFYGSFYTFDYDSVSGYTIDLIAYNE